jgi:hypothetical protein
MAEDRLHWRLLGWSRGPGGRWVEIGHLTGVRSTYQCLPEISIFDIDIPFLPSQEYLENIWKCSR